MVLGPRVGAVCEGARRIWDAVGIESADDQKGGSGGRFRRRLRVAGRSGLPARRSARPGTPCRGGGAEDAHWDVSIRWDEVERCAAGPGRPALLGVAEAGPVGEGGIGRGGGVCESGGAHCMPELPVVGVCDDHRITGSPDHRITGSPDHRITGSPDHRITGSPDHMVVFAAVGHGSGTGLQRSGEPASRRVVLVSLPCGAAGGAVGLRRGLRL